MPRNPGYILEREICDFLVSRNQNISADQISEAGGGIVVLVLSVRNPRRMNVYRLSKDLRFQARHSSAQVVAVTMPTQEGPAWEVVPLPYLQSLADEAVMTKDMHRLEAALRPRV